MFKLVIHRQAFKIALTVVHTACRANGQDSDIYLKLKDLVLGNDNAEVLRVVTLSFIGGMCIKSFKTSLNKF